MSEYIKYFDNLDEAEGYEIREVPFSGYINGSHLALFSKFGGTINQGRVSYSRYLFYTTNNQETTNPYEYNFGANLVDNTYNNGQGVMVFDGDITSIGEETFYGCTSLTTVTIPNSVTEIGWGAFKGCSSLTSVTIPNNVVWIGHEALYGCSSLTTITCEAVTPPTLYTGNNLSNVTAVYVPAESVNVYKTATNWSYYSSIIQPI